MYKIGNDVDVDVVDSGMKMGTTKNLKNVYKLLKENTSKT